MSNETDFKKILHSVTIFAGIGDDDFDKYFKKDGITHKEKGEVIIKEGTHADEIYILLEGSLKVVLDLDNEPLELLEIGPGKVVGEASVIGIQQHSASVIVIADATLFTLSRKTLMQIHDENAELFGHLILNISRELARRLYASNQIIQKYRVSQRK